VADHSAEIDLVCAVDLGGTNLRAATIDNTGRIYERHKTPTPRASEAQEIVTAIATAVRECEAQATARDAKIDAVSIVVPGSVQVESGLVVNAPNISSLQGYRLGPALEKELGRPVLLENDANAAAVGEIWQGAARGCGTVICLTLGTGVGGGIILDGDLWRGIDGTAGEIGHTSVEPFGGVRCKCGNFGCLEVYASATAMVRITREALAAANDSVLGAVPSTELTSEMVYRAASEGDVLAREVFRNVGVHLGIAMASLVNIFNPEMIVVGGGAAGGWEFFADHARAEVTKRSFPVPAQRCRIARAERGDDAGLLGAARLAFQHRK
jgi:glucokinase